MIKKTTKFRCAVLGANGYIGSHLVYQLLDSGYQVHSYDMQHESCVPCSTYTQLNIADRSAWDKFDSKVDLIFCFSGLTGTSQSFSDYCDFVNVNELGLLHLLDKIHSEKCYPKIIFPSTRLVYKGSESLLREDSPKATGTVYAVNKLACEGYLSAYHKTFGISYNVFRIGVPFGNRLKSGESYGTIGFFLKMARNGKNITVYGDGGQRRTFSSIQDICRQVLGVSLIQEIRDGVFNVGGEDFSLRTVAEKVAKIYGVKVEETDWPEEALRLESGSTVFDSSVIDELLANSPSLCCLKDWLDELAPLSE